tara:strand:+ start:643 stop:1578 length:936 start_codon:yes stop_codon:yes gene_type:complete
MNFQEIIKLSKPDLSDSSVKAYDSILKKLNTSNSSTLDFLLNTNNILNEIKENKTTTQQNKLNAIIVALKSNSNKYKQEIIIYQNHFNKLKLAYNEFLNKQEKTDTQNENWITYDELIKMANKFKYKLRDLKNKEELSKAEYEILLFNVILQTHINIPLRNDLPEFQIINEKNYTDDDNNYLVIKNKSNMYFVLNNYKTSKTFGKIIIHVPKKLNNLYNMWFRYNKSKYFITSIQDRSQPITTNNYTKYFNKLFHVYYPSKLISSSMVRHIIITERLKDSPNITQQNEQEKNTINLFQHNGVQNNIYNKII